MSRAPLKHHKTAWIRLVQQSLATALVCCLLLAGVALATVAGTLASASPASAGERGPGQSAAAPSVVFREDFETVQATTPTGLADYTGASPYFQKYTASSTFLDRAACNGIILNSHGQSENDQCGNYGAIQGLADVLGQVRGLTGDAVKNNHAVAAYTDHPMTADQVQFQTVTPIPTSGSKRFVSFSVDAAAVNCGGNDPQLKFYLLDGATAIPTFTTPINPCTDPRGTSYAQSSANGTSQPNDSECEGECEGEGSGQPYLPVKAGTFFADAPVLFSGASVGIKLVNGQGSYIGNDAAFDNVTLLDVTPQLGTSFSPSTILAGQTATATFTVTNTSELSVKTGFGFTQPLPAGLSVASQPSATTCGAGTTSTTADAVTLTGGVLAAGAATCTVTVAVTASAAASYVTDAPTALTGLNTPAPATLVVNPETVTLRAAFTGPRLDASDQYTVAVRRDGDTGPVINDLTGAVTTGNDASVATGSGSTGATAVTPGDAYYLTATAAEGSANPLGYLNQTITCTDRNGLQTGLPTATEFTGSLPLTPVVGAVLDCLLSLVPNAPALTVTRTDNPATVAAVDDAVSYDFVVVNTGNVTLTNVAITAAPAVQVSRPLRAHRCRLANIAANQADPCGGTTLAVGQSAPFTLTFVATQADLDQGTLNVDALATGISPTGAQVASAQNAQPATAVQSPALTLTETGTVADDLVTNTGNTTLAGVTVADPASGPVTCGRTTLAPGQSTTCTSTPRAVTASEFNAQQVSSQATAGANTVLGAGVTQTGAGLLDLPVVIPPLVDPPVVTPPVVTPPVVDPTDPLPPVQNTAGPGTPVDKGPVARPVLPAPVALPLTGLAVAQLGELSASLLLLGLGFLLVARGHRRTI